MYFVFNRFARIRYSNSPLIRDAAAPMSEDWEIETAYRRTDDNLDSF